MAALAFRSNISYGSWCGVCRVLDPERARQARHQTSTNRPKQCTDNAHTEPFFHTLKTELVHLRKFENGIEAVAAIVEFIEFYNRERLHSGIGYQSPASYVRALG
jgi:transposase InsO family protein